MSPISHRLPGEVVWGPPGGEVQKAAVDNGLKLEGEVRAGITRNQVNGHNSLGK